MGMKAEEGRAFQFNSQFVDALDLWYPTQPNQRMLWPSTVRLTGGFKKIFRPVWGVE
jgi:hypothetical protein